jgi:hypothetical protein
VLGALADRENGRIGGVHAVVDPYAVADVQAGVTGEVDARPHAAAEDDQLRLDR